MTCQKLIEHFYTDIAEPDVIAVILEADIALMIFTAAIVEQFQMPAAIFPG